VRARRTASSTRSRMAGRVDMLSILIEFLNERQRKGSLDGCPFLRSFC
jgi:hypothetical protein